jgi:TolB-like protein/Tfp pilus assembly protein PilF
MFTDIVGYTALMGSDEDKAFKVLRKNREIQRPIIKKYRGEWLKEMGDGILASFNTASDAVRCAGSIQQAVKKEGIGLRIGIHEGEVVFEGGDVLGDGVNVASRLEEMAEEGAINISGAVYKDIKNKSGISAEFIEAKILKNVEDPVNVYRVQFEEPEEEGKTSFQSVTTRKRLHYYIIGVLMAVIIAILIWNFLPSKNTTSLTTEGNAGLKEKSIAVLPFRNDSPDLENEYFCNGMMEEILTNLQKISELDVRSRTSVEQYRNTEKDIKTIASELGVNYLVEGSVQKIDDNIKITAQLIDANIDNHLWAEIYEGKYTAEIFKFQSQTALKIASSLNTVITPQEKLLIDKNPTSDIRAYDYLLQGQYMLWKYWTTLERKYLAFAHDLYDRVLELDPNYSKAVLLKMQIFFADKQYDSTLAYARRYIILNPDSAGGYYIEGECYRFMGEHERAEAPLHKALEISPNNPWANLALGAAYMSQKNKEINGLKYLQRALENSENNSSYSGILLNVGVQFLHIGDYSRAEHYIKKAIEEEVGCLGIKFFPRTLYLQGKIREAISFLDSICERSSCKNECYRQLFYSHMFSGNNIKAEAYFNSYIEAGGEVGTLDSIQLAYLYRVTDRIEKADIINTRVNKTLMDNLINFHLFSSIYKAMLEIQTGQPAKAIEYLLIAEEEGFLLGGQDFLEIDPVFEDLWDNPDFKALVKRSQDEKAALRAKVDEMIESGEINL